MKTTKDISGRSTDVQQTGNVFTFPGFVGVEIFGGTVQSATVTDEHGTRAVLTDVGKVKYFVDVIEADGTRIGMWDGTDHVEAVRQANMLALDFGGRVQDRTGDAA